MFIPQGISLYENGREVLRARSKSGANNYA